VWEDVNGNGLRDGVEPGFANIAVTLYTLAGVSVHATTTDNTGGYRFAGLAPGDYYLRIDPLLLPAGYQFTLRNQGDDGSLDSDVDPISGTTVSFRLSAGSTDTSWHAGLVLQSGSGPTNLPESEEPAAMPRLWLPMIAR
jgi:hypothetical protein